MSASQGLGLTGPDGRSGLRLAAVERFRVELANEAGARTLVHWAWAASALDAGRLPMAADSTDRERRGSKPMTMLRYRAPYWMALASRLAEQSLMTAPLIVHDVAELREDRQEWFSCCTDFTFRTRARCSPGLPARA